MPEEDDDELEVMRFGELLCYYKALLASDVGSCASSKSVISILLSNPYEFLPDDLDLI